MRSSSVAHKDLGFLPAPRIALLQVSELRDQRYVIKSSYWWGPATPGPIRPTGDGHALLTQNAARRLDPVAVRFHLIDEVTDQRC